VHSAVEVDGKKNSDVGYFFHISLSLFSRAWLLLQLPSKCTTLTGMASFQTVNSF
jgi:hypothetical protein